MIRRGHAICVPPPTDPFCLGEAHLRARPRQGVGVLQAADVDFSVYRLLLLAAQQEARALAARLCGAA